jgi:cellulose synthase/poly-beta-1,6-N-acetylglucosamine synthase-like glycosyltransferase
MASLFSYLLATLACLLGIPVAVFFIEVIAAIGLAPRKSSQQSIQEYRRRVAVIIPAHNESSGLLPTIEDIKTQLGTGDRLLIVADNCADDTATVAATTGAEVIERDEPTRMGKGYALDFGLKHLSLDPPTIVIIIDADCKVEGGAIDRLATTCASTHRPVQALDLMMAPDDSPINYRVAEFAWRVKNWVRPLGLNALNLPCQLMGTGMAFPWEVIRSAHLASGSLVEDLKLGLDLARTGSPPLFCPTAIIKSHFPLTIEGAESQRKRWEGGHISMILTTVPRLIYDAIAQGNLDLLALTFDLAIPPLSLLVILLTGMSSVGWLAVLFGAPSAALNISAICLMALVIAIFLSWWKFGRDLLPLGAIFLVASYVFAKLPIYFHLLFNSAAPQWTRTDRKKNE